LLGANPELTDALGEAITLARKAGVFIQSVRAEGFIPEQKADQTPVTRADTGSDSIIRGGLAELFPEDGILSEEHGEPPHGTSGRTWIIDPLDGTRGFIAGKDEYAVQIGLVQDGVPVLGVVYEPALDRLAWAAKGMGTYLVMRGGTTYPARLSPRNEFRNMHLVTSTSVSDALRFKILAGLGCQDSGMMHSVGVKVASILRGESDIYWSGHCVSYWDSCAPLVVLQEAGGILTDLDGEPYTYPMDADRFEHPTAFVASTGTNHEAICAKLKVILQGESH
jgi:3'(2'), 5'-bisphosphate nucleotidase